MNKFVEVRNVYVQGIIPLKRYQAENCDKNHPANKPNTIPVPFKHPPIPCKQNHSIDPLSQKDH